LGAAFFFYYIVLPRRFLSRIICFSFVFWFLSVCGVFPVVFLAFGLGFSFRSALIPFFFRAEIIKRTFPEV